MAITSGGLQKFKQALINLLLEGRYTMNGKTYSTPIFKTSIDGDNVNVYLYLDDSVSGNITQVQLIDRDGAVFDTQTENINKPSINGLLITFTYNLKKVV
ncbi:hypothetical protein [Heyndrickxia coagulans]|uniref:hypothetical protein n=1 Tax=Heyndrickxia coagulans TaxID=1398 RepID=UPI00223551AC|nr:hypothetical protein [Heyndrickxia coagulans]UZH06413.1 hypothetical protein ONG97_00265 [Heyndrickxia coagulans]UZH06463.1 hypothetical protein ONG97_00565 [Heyndrickxia coagulans]